MTTGRHRIPPPPSARWDDTTPMRLPPPPPRPSSWGPLGKAALQVAATVTTAVIIGAIGGALITWSQSQSLGRQVDAIEKRLDRIESVVMTIQREVRR